MHVDHLTQRIIGRLFANRYIHLGEIPSQANQEKPITHKEVTELLAKEEIESKLKKKGALPKYPLKMQKML